MDILIGVFQSLGVDSTLLVQFVLFIIGFLFLNNLLFKPYYNAYHERHTRTAGSENHSERLVAETEELEIVLSEKARALNTEHKKIFDDSRSKAIHEHDELVSQARGRAKDTLEKSRSDIQQEVSKARAQLQDEVPAVSKTIVNTLVGKDLV